ncbi:MAG TPA: hypothetical protein VMU17_00770, partial [Elusimicrobiota bacterium]|nr:hypothetical protein [Elusimicrobiota bacterium]
KMYANGQGVQEDMNKAEFLRSMAAVRLRTLPPGVTKEADNSMKEIADQISYIEDPTQGGTRKPVVNLSELLNSLDLNSIRRLGNLGSEETTETGAPPTPVSMEIPLPAADNAAGQAAPMEASAPPSRPAAVANATSAAPARMVVETPNLSNVRDNNQISLGLLREQATQGNAMAMRMLSAAYAKGYYGLKPNPELSRQWKEKALRCPVGPDTDEPYPGLPVKQLAMIAGMGSLLVGLGIWRWIVVAQARKRRRGKAHYF